MARPTEAAIKAESFGRGVLLLRLPGACHPDALTAALAPSTDLVADGPRAVVLDACAVREVDDQWARDLAETVLSFPSGLGHRAALVKPVDRVSALTVTRALDGVIPVFATRAGALFRAVIAAGGAR